MSQMKRSEPPARSARYSDGFRVLQGRREYVTYPEDSSIRIWYSDIPWQFETHDHSAVEMLLTLEGSVTYTVGNHLYEVRKGEVLIVPPDTLHSLTMGEGSSRYLFLFEPDALMSMRDIKSLDECFSKPFHLCGGSDTQFRIRDLLLKAREAYEGREMLWNTMCHSFILRIYAILAQQYLSGVRPKAAAVPRNMNPEIINAVMTYISNHYRDPLTLEDAAAFAGFSRCYFSRSFKSQTGYWTKVLYSSVSWDFIALWFSS